MPWWGWLLLGAGISALAVLLLWLLLRERRGAAVDRSGLIDSDRTRLAEELAAERVARNVAERTAAKLETELRAVADRKKRRLEELDEKTARKFRDLADDPDDLLARVDAILRGED